MNDRSFRVAQGLAAVVVSAGWLYILAFTFHNWRDRVWFAGLIICMLTSGLLFERWRQRGDRLARVPFFLAAAAAGTAILVSSISPRELAVAGVIAAVGAVAAWGVRAVGGEWRPGRDGLDKEDG